ncbi:unnamed protein product, partial [Rotaria socialis]
MINCDTSSILEKSTVFRGKSLTFIKIAMYHQNLGDFNDMGAHVPKLKCFILKSVIENDLEFVYLKWLLNNLNHITKLKIDLRSGVMWRTGQLIWKSVIGANFIRQYCLPDKMIHLKYFHFYIGRRYELSLVDIENTINSFKSDTFFISHQWTNIKFLYDKNESYQHIFSNFNKSQLSDSLFTQPFMYDWSDTRHISIDFDSSLYLFFDQLNELCSNVASITIYIILSSVGIKTLNYIQLRNVTTLRFGIYRGRT